MPVDPGTGVIAHAIQLAVAPVFLMTGIAALLAVMANPAYGNTVTSAGYLRLIRVIQRFGKRGIAVKAVAIELVGRFHPTTAHRLVQIGVRLEEL